MDEIKVEKKGKGRFVVFHESEFGLTEQRFETRQEAYYYHDNLNTDKKYFYKDRKSLFNPTLKLIIIFGSVIIFSLVAYKLLEYFDVAMTSDAIEMSSKGY